MRRDPTAEYRDLEALIEKAKGATLRADLPQASRVLIDAAFPSRCGECGERIGAGARIAWAKGHPTLHARCWKQTAA